MRYPVTPDDRYFVVKGQLWRCSNPTLDEATRKGLVSQLMDTIGDGTTAPNAIQRLVQRSNFRSPLERAIAPLQLPGHGKLLRLRKNQQLQQLWRRFC
jgi:hypothetical protein